MDLERIDELAHGVEGYLKQLSVFTSELRDVKHTLDKLREAYERDQSHQIERLTHQVEALTETLRNQGVIPPNEYEIELDKIRELMNGGEWPVAVQEDRICNTDEQQKERANGIMRLFVSEYLKDKRFLDFGCGAGYTIPVAKDNEAQLAVGYDIKSVGGENVTSDWSVVKASAPYDVILLHDVLDHIEMFDPIEALRKVKSVLASDGHIYVRNHPWSSRHGGHIYQRKNLAFLHLVLDAVELTRVEGLEADYNVKVLTPVPTYRYWFHEAGLRVDSEMPIKTPVEDYFKKPSCIHSRLVRQWPEGEDPYEHMEIDFVEYVLSMDISEHQII